MADGLQVGQATLRGEHHLGQSSTVNSPVGPENAVTELGHHSVTDLPEGEDVTSQGVDVDDHRTPFCQEGGHCGLPGANAPAEAYDLHADRGAVRRPG